VPKKVIIYRTQSCVFCAQVVRLLEEKKISFEEIDLTDDDAKREELQEKTGWMTVPMVFIGDEFIGGYDEMQVLADSGKLDEKIASE